MKKAIFIILSISLLLACTTKKEEQVKISELAKSYKKLKRMTKKPVLVNPGIAMLCIGPTKAMIEDAKKEKGPHAIAEVHMYMNETAVKAFKTKPFKFPEGSVIVKDKLNYDKGVGGMVKRHKGYDPKNGDWEYFYFDKPDKIESGKIQSCIKCHSAKAKTDYVFGNWAQPREMMRIKTK